MFWEKTRLVLVTTSCEISLTKWRNEPNLSWFLTLNIPTVACVCVANTAGFYGVMWQKDPGCRRRAILWRSDGSVLFLNQSLLMLLKDEQYCPGNNCPTFQKTSWCGHSFHNNKKLYSDEKPSTGFIFSPLKFLTELYGPWNKSSYQRINSLMLCKEPGLQSPAIRGV